MKRTDFNKYLLEELELDKETFERVKDLANTMVANGMTYEQCVKIVTENI